MCLRFSITARGEWSHNESCTKHPRAWPDRFERDRIALRFVTASWRAGQKILPGAIFTLYRRRTADRSQFDGQELLESGLPKPGAVDTGRLNRAPAGLDRATRRICTAGPPSRSDPSRRWSCAVPRAGHVMNAAAPAAGQRGDPVASPRPLSPAHGAQGVAAAQFGRPFAMNGGGSRIYPTSVRSEGCCGMSQARLASHLPVRVIPH
jgi:hypothetical protein